MGRVNRAHLQLLTAEFHHSLKDVSECSIDLLLFVLLDYYIQPKYVLMLKQLGAFCLRRKHGSLQLRKQSHPITTRGE